MMIREDVKFELYKYDSLEDLETEDADLLSKAREITTNAYAPYSQFNVGAYARLVNGEMVSGTNQENASYPAGICAERTLMSVAASLYPGVGIKAIAITYNNLNGNSNKPVSPCGICRQSFAEFQQRTGQPIRIILSGMEGEVQVIENALFLLPLVFGSDDMK